VSTLIALVVAACGGTDRNPYAELSSRAARYVIPDSAGWSFGELCPDGGDCSGAVGVEVIKRYDWVRFDRIDVPRGQSSKRSIRITLRVVESLGKHPVAPARLKAWGPSVAEGEHVLALGHELWAASDPEDEYVMIFVAFDKRGRFAAVGHAAADYFTLPVAELAASSGSPSGRAYLKPLIAR
jgi:hypothetical protein